MTPLSQLLTTYREASQTEREKGTYFEQLVKVYLLNEPAYKDLFNGQVYLWEEWRAYWISLGNIDPGVDAGIDLVAVEAVAENPRIFAIQAKFYAEDSKIRKGDGIDSFLSAMGKQPYTNGLLFLTTYQASAHVIELIQKRDKPVNIVSLSDLEQSQIDWTKYQPDAQPEFKAKKQLRDHQKTALRAVSDGLKTAERGKLIMACGTGKTFTSLKIAETLAGKGKRVLFLVPSLSLLSQSLTEWTQESDTPLHSFAVCSDSDVGKKKRTSDDDFVMQMHELRYPATTNPARLATAMTTRHDPNHMSVVFSTYHSINVIGEAQQLGMADFDLIICDEAHRTTGATFGDEDESAFVKVHDGSFIKSSKRLYMTATPRIYGDSAKAKAESDNVALCSMDDVALYGQELYVISFSEAVRLGLLCDYKVMVLAVEESHVSRRLQSLLKDQNNQLKVDDAAKIVGCWKALAKQGLKDDFTTDHEPMKRAVAFCQVIEPAGEKAKTHKVSSKNIAGMFQSVVEAYQEVEKIELAARITCEAEHVDGSMNASQKETKLTWLKAETPSNTCRVLSNVRCLSEGVDVPALDAVLFLTPRNSQVDVVQSVGRVMRNAPGKKRGYVILPVVIPAGVEPHEALNDNKTYAVVWQVLQALRSHDDRFDAMVNKIDLDLNKNILSKMEVISITDKIPEKQKKATGPKNKDAGKNQYGIGQHAPAPYHAEQQEMQYEIGEIERAIYAKVVQKCGNRHHWEDWANDIAKIARTHIDRIHAILENEQNQNERDAFKAFATELRDDLNDSISDDEIVEMLAQHLITKPVFDALFEGYSFAQHNPMSLAMQGVLDALHEHQLKKETDTLESFYASVRHRAEGIENASGKQKIVVELYDKFFRNAFPKMTERLGIVYTPVEVVDFIIHSVNHILQTEFGQTLGSKGVHILDPFTGTGTFITRLLQSGLIKPEELPHKYKHEIHANEIVLLAYYIAAINIEAVYHSIVGGEYQPFEGICLTDTFQLYEKEDLVDQILVKNSARRKRQKKLDIRVIMGNPPYSVGQSSANDDNQNISYPHLDERIRSTYAERSEATLKNALYDSYIRAIRWASDRIGNAGVIGFVTNAGFLEAKTADGLRKCLADEFSNIYVFHLRGNQRTSGELSRKEGGKIFGSGSRAPIAISLLVKNPDAKQHGQIYWHDIGEYLSREKKLEIITDFASIEGIKSSNGWLSIKPNEHADWINQRDNTFNKFALLSSKDSDVECIFQDYSNGIKTNRDAWCYNYSKSSLSNNIIAMLETYNSELKSSLKDSHHKITMDPRKISWSSGLQNNFDRRLSGSFRETSLRQCLYRPFTSSWVYFDSFLNDRPGQMPRIFPADCENLIIWSTGVGATVPYSCWISGSLCSIQQGPAAVQHFPLYLYESTVNSDTIDFEGTGDLFAAKADKPAASKGSYTRKDAITDSGLKHFSDAYPGEKISKEDLFYYVYGLLHSPDYRERYADNLSKELPRIPAVKTAKDFWHFSKAGRDLAELHLNYETVKPYPVKMDVAGKTPLTDADYRVEKMKYGKSGKDKDLTTLIYNHRITLTGIPLEAYDYEVNGKPALDWVVERQCVKTDKDSGIVNDANLWATETVGDAKYPLELFMRVITVSLETMKIVNGLPKLDI